MRFLKILDIPQYLSYNKGQVDNVKMVCVLNRQIKMPKYLEGLEKLDSNIPAIVDIIGVDINNQQFIVRGQAVVILGPRAFEPVKTGKRVLLLQGNLNRGPFSASSNHVELTLKYRNRNNKEVLYATKTLYKEYKDISRSYPIFAQVIDKLALEDWDYDKLYNKAKYPDDYRISCSNDKFEEINEDEKFNFLSESEYKQVHRFDNLKDEPGIEDNNSIKKVNIVRYESRDKIKEKPVELEELKKKYRVAENRTQMLIKQMSKIGSNEEIQGEKMDYLYSQLKDNWRRSPSNESATGRSILKNVISYLYPEYENKYMNGKPFIDNAIDNLSILDLWYRGEMSKKVQELKDEYFFSDFINLGFGLYIGFIDYLLNLKCHLIEAYKYGVSLNIDIFSVMQQNPYYLCLVDSRLNIEDMDKIAKMYRVDIHNESISTLRNAAYMHNYLLDSNNYVVENNTLVLKKDIQNRAYNGYMISSREHKNLMTYGMILSPKIKENLQEYVKKDLVLSDFTYQRKNWVEIFSDGQKKYFQSMYSDSLKMLNDYIKSGLGTIWMHNEEEYLIDYSHIQKELYIINKLYEMSENGQYYEIDENNLERCIRAFEMQKSIEWGIPNFKLEIKQKDGVKALCNPILCVTGPAGSGKTTTAEAILFALQALLGVEEDKICFVAPTGRAASRLKEVVKKPTRTIHSMFSLSISCYTVIPEDDADTEDIDVLIVDESSMIDLDVMYNMLLKIKDTTRIVFLGDADQLPPIGFGKPFADILKFLPCVALEVPKRAAENSGITQNANNILNSSPENFDVFDDFRIISVDKARLKDLVVGIINYHLGRAGEKRVGNNAAAHRVLQSLGVNLSPDDIQVITPVKKYEWGTKALNPVIQDVINPRKIGSKVIRVERYNGIELEYKEYRENDRVIHLENRAHEYRYIQHGPNVFERLLNVSGVMNGDIGKIIGFFSAYELSFIDKEGNVDDKTAESFGNDSDLLYMAVKYKDTDENGNKLEYIIFYPAVKTLNQENKKYYDDTGIITVSGPISYLLDLAYALTVHKVQGSEAKLVICILFNINGNFLSKNLVYTAISRAEEGIYLIGDVVGQNNTITKAKGIDQNKLRETVVSTIFNK